MFPDLRTFMDRLRADADLVTITAPVDAHLEAAEIHRRVIAAGGPALLFRNPVGHDMPVVTNLFGTKERVDLAFGLVTRIAAGLQVPALVGAVLLVHLREGLMSQSQSLELSMLVLFMLLVFVVFGSGRLSLDRYVFGVEAEEARPRRSGADHGSDTTGPLAGAA